MLFELEYCRMASQDGTCKNSSWKDNGQVGKTVPSSKGNLASYKRCKNQKDVGTQQTKFTNLQRSDNRSLTVPLDQ